ncbi:MAG: hypothetical protein ACTTJW_04805 [Sphaerochaeta sp.]
MSFGNFVRHTAIVILGLTVLLGIPFILTDYGRNLIFRGNVDLIGSATVILDKPSGRYFVLINSDMHKDKEKLDFWVDFFGGGDVSFIFEDIHCSVARGDTGALDMANSFRSRLPENQMSLKIEDSVLLLSRADNGKFDIIVMSSEFAERNKAFSAVRDNVILIDVNDKEEL